MQGIQGIQGTQGTQGNQGVQGNQGSQGSQGVQGVQGTQGNQGLSGVYLSSSSPPYPSIMWADTATTGTPGPQGVQGTPYTAAYSAAGQIGYGTGSGTGTSLSIGTSGQVLTVNSSATAPVWASPIVSPTNPLLNGFKAWTFDPATMPVVGTNTIGTGTTYFQAVYLQAGTVCTNLYTFISAAGTTATTNLGLYDSTTLRLSGSSTTASGLVTITGSPYTIPTTGVYWLAILITGTTAGSYYRTNTTGTNAFFNANTTAAANTLSTRAQSLGSQSSLISPISGTPGATGNVWWIGVS